MSEYKRLTNPNIEEYNIEIDFCTGCPYHSEPNGCNREQGECGNYERFCEMYDRLAELEDKIDSGELCERSEVCEAGYCQAREFRKETAREILNVISELGSCTNNHDMKWFADTVTCKLKKEYGVEVEE